MARWRAWSTPIASLLIVLVAGCSKPADSAAGYFALKAKYTKGLDSAFAARGDARPYIHRALNDLEPRVRALVGPVSPINGKAPVFSLDDLPEGEGGREVDGLVWGRAESDTMIIVTTPALLSGWLRENDQKPTAADPFAGLDHEAQLTWVFPNDAHVYPYADVKTTATSTDSLIVAKLIRRSQDLPSGVPPTEIILAVRHGPRVFLILAPAPAVPTPAECARLRDEEAFRACYARVAPTTPGFERVVAEARRWVAFVAAR